LACRVVDEFNRGHVRFPVDLENRAWGVVVSDVDRDGWFDLVAATGDSVRVMLGDGCGAFSTAPGSPIAAS
jgi:hypothetical protein